MFSILSTPVEFYFYKMVATCVTNITFIKIEYLGLYMDIIEYLTHKVKLNYKKKVKLDEKGCRFED